MRLPDRRGTPVDPVPFLVAALTGVAVCLAVGPPYLLALGLGFAPAVATAATCD